MDCELSDDKNNHNLAKLLRDFLIGLPRAAKQVVALSADAIGFALSAIAASWLLFGTTLGADQLAWIGLTAVVIGLPLAWAQLFPRAETWPLVRSTR